MKFIPFKFPVCVNADASLAHIRELSENCCIRPAPLVLGCKPWREFALAPVGDEVTRLISIRDFNLSLLTSAPTKEVE